jgi:hypothetical protein
VLIARKLARSVACAMIDACKEIVSSSAEVDARH